MIDDALMLRFSLLLLGIGLTVTGLFTFFLPVPGGFLPAVFGVALIVSVSPKAKKAIQWVRRRYRRLDRSLIVTEEKLRLRFPRLADILAKTKP